jgi:hypothetical protein
MRPALPEERGADLRPDRADPAPEAVRHVVETIDERTHDEHEGPPYDRCIHCERAGRLGGINPFEECPARELPTAIEVRADQATADDGQADLGSALARADGGRSG